MRWLVTAALFLSVLVMGTVTTSYVWPAGAKPDLVVILLVQIAFTFPRLDGVICAWSMGLVTDLYDTGPLGLMAVTYALIALAIHGVRRQVFADRLFPRVVFVVATDVLLHLVLMISAIIRGHSLDFFFTSAIMSVVYTAAAALLLLPLLARILQKEA